MCVALLRIEGKKKPVKAGIAGKNKETLGREVTDFNDVIQTKTLRDVANL